MAAIAAGDARRLPGEAAIRCTLSRRRHAPAPAARPGDARREWHRACVFSSFGDTARPRSAAAMERISKRDAAILDGSR
jgi:hypothetical protein